MSALKLLSFTCFVFSFLLFGMGSLFIYDVKIPILAFVFLVFAGIFILLSGYIWQATKN